MLLLLLQIRGTCVKTNPYLLRCSDLPLNCELCRSRDYILLPCISSIHTVPDTLLIICKRHIQWNIILYLKDSNNDSLMNKCYTLTSYRYKAHNASGWHEPCERAWRWVGTLAFWRRTFLLLDDCGLKEKYSQHHYVIRTYISVCKMLWFLTIKK